MTARSRASLRTGHRIHAGPVVSSSRDMFRKRVGRRCWVRCRRRHDWVNAAAERAPAPAVEAVSLDGDRIALRDLPGPVVNFWPPWCGPCAKEAPALRNVAAAYEGRVTFIGVNVKGAPAAGAQVRTGLQGAVRLVRG